MATMPPRTPALEDSIPSLINQCDVLNIYLNDFNFIPKILIHPKINILRSQDHLGDLGDVGKFYPCDTWNEGYIFTVDDKIIYPKTYAQDQIKAIEKYGRKAVVSCHGRMIKPNCYSYYNDFASFYCVYSNVFEDIFVHELGTGVMAFHYSTVKVDLDIFPTINMTDIYFSIALQRRNIPILVRKHFRGDFKVSKKYDDTYSIHSTFNKNKKDEFQTKVVNDFSWKINKCPLATNI